MKLTNAMRLSFVASAMNDVPQINYVERIHSLAIETAVSLLPPAIKAAYANGGNRPYINTGTVYLGCQTIYYPGTDDSRSKIVKACESLIALQARQTESRDGLSRNLHAIANSCSTRKALAEALPEFEQYLPVDEAAGNRLMPVVTGVVAAFSAAGWPKGKKSAAKAA